MAENAPLLREGSPNPDLNSGNTEGQIGVYDGRAETNRKRLALAILILSSVGSVFFLASYIIARNAPFTSWYHWDAGRVNGPLSLFMFLSALFALFSLYFKIPALLAYIIQVTLVAFIINFLIPAFYESRFPSSKWCRVTFGGEHQGPINPHPQCEDWRLALSILMGTAIGLAIITSVVYISALVYQTLAAVFGLTWKGRNILTFNIPSGTFKFEVNIGFVRQEPAQQSTGTGEASTSTSHGPLYL